MRKFKVFKHPSGRMEAVKQGWSWPGFLFVWIWALFKKLWAIGLGVLVGWPIFILTIQSVMGDKLFDLLALPLLIAMGVTFGLKGNAWRESNLRSRGYAEMGTFEARNGEAATALHLNIPEAPAPSIRPD